MHDIESSECDSTRKQSKKKYKKFPFFTENRELWGEKLASEKIFPLTQVRVNESEENFSLV